MEYLALLLSCLIAGDQAPEQGKQPSHSLPQEILQRWEKEGAIIGWMEQEEFGAWSFHRAAPDRQEKPASLPGFLIETKPLDFNRLSIPRNPFGVDHSRCLLTQSILEDLAKLTHLHVLNLGSVNDVNLKNLRMFKQLRSLSLSQATEQQLNLVLDLTTIESLKLEQSEVTHKWLNRLITLRQLRSLCFCDMLIDDTSLGPISNLVELRQLEMRNTVVRGSGLRLLGNLRNLESLALVCNDLKEGIEEVAKLQKLRKLSLHGSVATDDKLREIAKLSELEILDLGQWELADHAAFKALTRLQRLRRLYLENSKMTDAALKELPHFPQLETLILDSMVMTDKGISEFARMDHLCNLELRCGEGVTDKGLAAFAKLTKLRTLSLTGDGITKKGVADLRIAIPKCNITHFGGACGASMP